jgi:TonB family protein
MRTWILAGLTLVVLGLAAPSAAQMRQATRFVDLAYPAAALAARVKGAVVVRVTLDASGSVTAAEALSGPAALRAAAVENARQWTFTPGASSDAIVYRFDIEHGACNDDSRSLFQLASPNLAIITACSGPGRRHAPIPPDDVPLIIPERTATYPRIARNARVTGVVVLELTTDATGAVTAARALNVMPLLADAALEQAKRWRTKTPTSQPAIVVYEFALDLIECQPNDRALLHRVTNDYLRLSACGPLVNPDQSRSLTR